MKLLNNLRINSGGRIYTQDGTDLQEYLKASILCTSIEEETPIVILPREKFIELYERAYIIENYLIEAA
jgi:hypothetical protein